MFIDCFAVKLKETNLYLQNDSVLRPIFSFKINYFTEQQAQLLCTALVLREPSLDGKLVLVSYACTKETE